MKVRSAILIALLAVILLFGLGVLANRMGGVAIRGTAAQPSFLTLSLSEPVVRGVAMSVHWDSSQVTAERVKVIYRDQAGELELADGPAQMGSAFVKFPCATKTSRATLVLRNSSNNNVLSTRSVDLLPAGRECVLF